MTNEVLADVDAPCSLPIFHDDERRRGTGDYGGCLTHELEDDGAGGLLTYRSVIRNVSGLAEDQSAAVFARLAMPPTTTTTTTAFSS